MLILGIESAGPGGSVALLDAAVPAGTGRRLGELGLPPGPGTADHLVGLIERLLVTTGRGYGDLSLLAIGCGPGSFTGIRSAVALGRGLALATGLPTLAIGSLEALAMAAGPGAGALLAALDARRGQVYCQIFTSDLRAMGDPDVMAPSDAAALGHQPGLGLRLVGTGAPLIAPWLAAPPASLHAELPLAAAAVAERAAWRLAKGEQPVPGSTLAPCYLRPPDAKPARPPAALRSATG